MDQRAGGSPALSEARRLLDLYTQIVGPSRYVEFSHGLLNKAAGTRRESAAATDVAQDVRTRAREVMNTRQLEEFEALAVAACGTLAIDAALNVGRISNDDEFRNVLAYIDRIVSLKPGADETSKIGRLNNMLREYEAANKYLRA